MWTLVYILRVVSLMNGFSERSRSAAIDLGVEPVAARTSRGLRRAPLRASFRMGMSLPPTAAVMAVAHHLYGAAGRVTLLVGICSLLAAMELLRAMTAEDGS